MKKPLLTYKDYSSIFFMIKPGRLLAWRLKQQESEKSITNIVLSNGKTAVDTMEIKTAFKLFYKELYTSDYNASINL